MKSLKILSGIIGFVVFGILMFLGYVWLFLPNVGKAPDIQIEVTPERVERGKYLATHVAVCIDCHATRDWTKFGIPPIPGTDGKGGELFDQKIGFPGKYYSTNITPYELKKWTDGELYRAIAAGVSRDGRALFPVMPHPNYGRMSKEDIYSIIAYLRTLEPIVNDVPMPTSDFPYQIAINYLPKKPQHNEIPSKSDVVKYGEYIANASICMYCHTPNDKGRPIKEKAYSGGFEFPLPTGGVVRSANLTQDKATGIGRWTKEEFIDRFKAYKSNVYTAPKVPANTFNTFMPWTMYADMNEEDLVAIYMYLKTIKPIFNKVTKFSLKKAEK